MSSDKDKDSGNADVFSVIRSVGERTAELCRQLVIPQVPAGQVVLISEVPFSFAVQRTFELGIESGRDWTLAIDADVLPHSQAVNQILKVARGLPANVFEVEFRVFDKCFGGPRDCGVHLYRTAMLDRALSLAVSPEPTHRPESRIANQMHANGYLRYWSQLVLGIHDFEQSYFDLFRKGFVHAQKWADHLEVISPYWKRMAPGDFDFAALLLGMEAGLREGGFAFTDFRQFGEQIHEQLKNANLAPKPSLALDVSPTFVNKYLRRLAVVPEFRKWQKLRTGTWLQRTRAMLGQSFDRIVAMAGLACKRQR